MHTIRRTDGKWTVIFVTSTNYQAIEVARSDDPEDAACAASFMNGGNCLLPKMEWVK